MTDQEILDEIEKRVKESETWNVYHRMKDNLGHPTLRLQENCPRADHQGASIDVFNGHAYVFLDNGTPAEPGRPLSIQKTKDLAALADLLEIIRPYIRKG